MSYHVTAECEIYGCPLRQFSTVRSRIWFYSKAARQHRIKKIPCPSCGHPAQIVTITASKEVTE